MSVDKHVIFKNIDGKGFKVAIVVANWNPEICESLEKWCVRGLLDTGVQRDHIVIEHVPGSYELPIAAKQFADSGKYDAVVAIGCLIKGETMHFEYIAEAVSQGIMNVGLETGVPTIFGVLTCLNQEQAAARSQDNEKNSGYSWGKSAVEMAHGMKHW